MTRVSIVGAGQIGANLARFLTAAGHDVMITFSKDPTTLTPRATELGVRAGSPAEAAEHGEVLVLSVPWSAVDEAIAQLGGPGALAGKLVIDTTNQFGRFGVLDLGGESGARFNAAKAPGATWSKAFNTLTSGFQASSSGRTGPDRVAMFYATDDDAAAPTLEKLIDDSGFAPVRTGSLARTDVGHQEPKGELYGEEFHREDALAAVQRLRGTIPAGTGRP